MLVALPAAAGLLFFLLLQKKGWDWRTAALGSAVLLGVCVFAISEGLGRFHFLTRAGSTLAWLGVFACALLLWGRAAPAPPLPRPRGVDSDLGLGLKLAAGGTGLIVILVLVTALVCPPHTWDAMVYHLPRAVMWISNQNVDFYPTPDYQQLVFAPWAEYAMAQTMLLSGSDGLVNLVEFCSFLGCAIGVSLIAKFLGAGAPGQWIAAIVCLTIPTLVLEASGPMNTAVASFWIVASVAFVLTWNERQNVPLIVFAGCAAGLAILTKGIAYSFLPWPLAACWWIGGKEARAKLLKLAWIPLAVALALNAPHFARCYRLTGSVLGMPPPDPMPRLELTVQHKTWRGTAANVLRNLSLHVGTPSEHVNGKIESAFRKAISALGEDPDDSAYIWLGEKFSRPYFSMHEVHAGEPLDLILLVGAIAALVWNASRGGGWKPLWFAAGIGAGFLFFCATLRWHHWMSRLQEPGFVLGAALIGLVLEKRAWRRAAVAVAGILVLAGLADAVSNRTRALVPWSRVEDIYHPRAERYFLDSHMEFRKVFIAAAAEVNRLDCNRVDIDPYVENQAVTHTPFSFFVYPIMALIHADGGARKVSYTGIQNQTERYAANRPPGPACAVICLDCGKSVERQEKYEKGGWQGNAFGQEKEILVYWRGL